MTFSFCSCSLVLVLVFVLCSSSPVIDFLRRFYSLYDSDNRSQLDHVYADEVRIEEKEEKLKKKEKNESRDFEFVFFLEYFFDVLA